jgi:hypothetical protein
MPAAESSESKEREVAGRLGLSAPFGRNAVALTAHEVNCSKSNVTYSFSGD